MFIKNNDEILKLFFYLFSICLLMISLFIIAENFLIPNLENVSKKYNLKIFEGILLGIGGSVPELSTNLMATLKGNVELGIGAISGSGAMVLIFCFGFAGVVNEKNGKLNGFVYLRDVGIYLFVVGMLKIFLKEKKIYFFQCCFMISLFFVYVLIVKFSKNLCKNKEKNNEKNIEKEQNLIEMSEIEKNKNNTEKNNNNNKKCLSSTYEFLIKIYSYFLPKNESYPILSFIINLLAIIIHSNSLIILIELISNLLKINQSFLGMTLISWGDNLGDIINAYILSKKNSMETLSSSLISSQIFNILICLNLPWFILLIKNYFNGINFNFIEINFNNFNSLFISVFSSVFIIVLFCMKLNKINGIFLIVVYFCYLYYEFNLSKKNK